jgi:hypothetical protein
MPNEGTAKLCKTSDEDIKILRFVSTGKAKRLSTSNNLNCPKIKSDSTIK